MKASEKIKELNAKSAEELKAQKIDLLKEQFNLRMQKGTGQLTKHHMFKNIRRDIARINTILSTKQKVGS
ncbi:50S ribosomal protein L29 [Caedibacter taeniospiralis]|jgi:large subunit ribosomal protein L29|uniref:50S ribosomal protein L29 n=1 Tax=Caedibacter taeniospiralis TaxID=28907 RepID=UPI0037C13C16